MKTTQHKIGSSIENSQATITTNLFANKRTALKMVPSTFEPPQQLSPTQPDSKSRLSVMLNRTKASKDLQLQSDIQSQYSSGSFNPNIQFITSLLVNKQLICFDQGDCIPIADNHDRWVITNGEVKVTGVNQSSFTMKEGFVFFASPETKRKVKQIVALSPTSAYRIPQQIFKSSIRNYLYIKNSQKIKFLQFCPFIQWPQSLSQDIALTIEPYQLMEKETMIYSEGEQAKYLYFVKQGIVLLERTGKIGNQIILDFEKHYESSYLGDDQGLVIVRKGMVFGVDGILIKEISRQVQMQCSQLKDSSNALHNSHKQKEDDLMVMKNQIIVNSGIQNLENYVNSNMDQTNGEKPSQPKSIVRLKTTRIYNAKSIGKCELYKIDKNVLQTYLKSQDKTSGENEVRFSNKQLDRICLQYTNLLMGSNHTVKELKKKNFELNVKLNETEMQFKKKKVEQIKMQQKRLRKITLNPEHKKPEHNMKQPEPPFPSMVRSPRKSLKQLSKKSRDISLPSLKNKKYVQNIIFKKIEAQKMQKQAEKYLSYKRKIQNSLLAKDHKEAIEVHSPQQNQSGLGKVENSQFISVRSYRSLLTPFHG